MSIAAFIPARGGSKGIPDKNITEYRGKPLIWWAANAAQQCEGIDMLYISTDSQRIADTVLKFGFDKLQIHYRDHSTATDTAPSELALLQFCHDSEYNDVCFLQATSPGIQSKDIDRAIAKYTNYDSIVSVSYRHLFVWQHCGGGAIRPCYDIHNRPRRQEWEGLLTENGALYLSSRQRILSTKCRVSGKIGYITMPEFRGFEVDNQEDLR